MKIEKWLGYRVLTFTFAALIAGPLALDARAEGDDEEEEFDEASIFFELNDTDGDLGIHALIDGDAWKKLEIEREGDDKEMLEIRVRGRLRKQGLTELFFESAEPPFDELSPKKFFRRFPEGEYEIEGETLDGRELESTVELSHVLAAPAGGITLSGTPAAEDCDVSPLPTIGEPVVIDWDPVTTSHPDLGDMGPIEVEHYEVVVEREEPPLVLKVELSPDTTEFTIPSELIEPGEEVKFEILVRADNGNQTAVESCFEVD